WSMFFFSSRRRHTRSKRDGGSDVCFSDLSGPAACLPAGRLLSGRGPMPPVLTRGSVVGAERSRTLFDEAYRDHARRLARAIGQRSEERRVGKECRSRGGREQ